VDRAGGHRSRRPADRAVHPLADAVQIVDQVSAKGAVQEVSAS
jgi:hypothetical protein